MLPPFVAAAGGGAGQPGPGGDSGGVPRCPPPPPPPPPGKPRHGGPAPPPAPGAEGVNGTLSIGLYFLKKFIRFLQGDQKRVLAFPQAPSKQSPGLKIQNFV